MAVAAVVVENQLNLIVANPGAGCLSDRSCRFGVDSKNSDQRERRGRDEQNGGFVFTPVFQVEVVAGVSGNGANKRYQ